MNRLTNKVALVSGEALGMGRAFADLLAQEGAAVIIADLDHSPSRSQSAPRSGRTARDHRRRTGTLQIRSRPRRRNRAGIGARRSSGPDREQ